jgi:hypothetical protein
MATCPFCNDTGSVSTYWGEVYHPNWGSIRVDGEHFDPTADCPGGIFYGGSSHKACRCRVAVSKGGE